MTIAENIKKLREQYGLTQAELGEIAGVSDKAVSTWENGTAEPRMGAIQKIAEHFHVTKGSIVDDLDPKNGQQESYYIDPETAEMAQAISEEPGLRALFHASRNLTADDLQMVTDMAKRFKQDLGE